ncbi:MAG: UDP-N-acetylmuramoyl-tripeptide--D-alanyl-D-alanine ligase [Phycisphaerae bacterium]
MKALGIGEICQAVGGRWMRRADGHVAKGVTTDSREVKKDWLFIALRGERFDGHAFIGQAAAGGAVAAIVHSQAALPAGAEGRFPAGLIGVDDTLEALGRLGAYYRSICPARVIAVTGSNGKTTVKRMIHHILSRRFRGSCSPKSFNNNIGVPLTLLGVEADDQYVVCELGTNAPGEIASLAALCKPRIAVITSVCPTHLEKLGSVEGVAAEKASLLGRLQGDGVAIVNGDSQPLADAMRTFSGRVVRFGRRERNDLKLTGYEVRGMGILPMCGKAIPAAAKGPGKESHEQDARATHGRDAHATPSLLACRFQVNGGPWADLPLAGRHNAVNALAAIGVAMEFGMGVEDAAAALADMETAEGRLQVVPCGGVTVINDAYNANPASVVAAAEVLADCPASRRVMILGDMRELGNGSPGLHEQTGRDIAAMGIDLLIAVGEMGRYFAIGAQSVGMKAVRFDSVESAAAAAPALLLPGDVVVVKGSHTMAMDRLVAPIREAMASPAGRGQTLPAKGGRKMKGVSR